MRLPGRVTRLLGDERGVDLRAVVAGVILFGLLAVSGELLIRRDEAGVERQLEARVQSEAASIRATVEAELNQTVFLAIGLSGYVEAFPELGDDEQVEALLSSVYERSQHIKNIGLAPDNVVSIVFPVEGNERALGLRYKDHPDQYDEVLRAMQTRATVLAGPLELVQGGVALINRTPVFLRDGDYWGIVSLVVDIESLIDEVTRRIGDVRVDWSIRAFGGEDGAVAPVVGDQGIFDRADSIQEITIPDGRWEVGAVAQGALQPWAQRTTLFRVGGALIALSLGGLAFLFARERTAVQRQARQDPLTSLPNRRHLEEQLEQLISGARRRDDSFSLVFVDLDGFKSINDRHGHATGDAVLTEVGRRLVERTRLDDVVARVGGDEFIVLLPGTVEATDARAAVAKLAEVLRTPISVGRIEVEVGASIGVGHFPEHGTTASELISRVDDAMYAVKRERDGDALVRVRYLDELVESDDDAEPAGSGAPGSVPSPPHG